MMKVAIKPPVVRFYCLLAIVLASGVFLLCRLFRELESGRNSHPSDTLVCILAMPELQYMSDELYIGYCYDLMKAYAADRGKTASVRLAGRKDNLRNLLLDGSADIVCTAAPKALKGDSLCLSTPLDDLFLCFTGKNNPAESALLEAWIRAYGFRPDRESVRNRYLRPFNPRGTDTLARSEGYICPYDRFIRNAADVSGFDWRFLAAMLYQESRFHIEAASFSGAVGLSQLMPSTAAAMGITDRLDPESNIMAGALYLRKIYQRIRRTRCNDCLEFALAAYNVGMGNLSNAREHAAAKGLDPNLWADVRSSMILMDKEAESSVYTQAVLYVDSVLSFYRRYKVLPR